MINFKQQFIFAFTLTHFDDVLHEVMCFGCNFISHFVFFYQISLSRFGGIISSSTLGLLEGVFRFNELLTFHEFLIGANLSPKLLSTIFVTFCVCKKNFDPIQVFPLLL